MAVVKNATLPVNATVDASANLTVTPNAINFPDADPDTVSSIPADSPLTVKLKVTGNANNGWQLTATANSDLLDPGSGTTISASNISWTTTSGSFINGQLVVNSPQIVASGQGNANSTGVLSFFLANSWDYTPGTYNTTVTFTLTAPV
ncbi:MAG: hypothetical protein JXR42_06080 [Gammaproteobacteria bacterium]|nr:hypothetical protein [Gammaproteobacteria bacterium]